MSKLETINIKGKEYVPVNVRLQEFRKAHPDYSLETDVIELDLTHCVLKAIIKNDKERILATGLAREEQADSNSFVNKTSYVENCETSAWGRALGNLGIGIDESIASAQEVGNAVKQQEAQPKTKEEFIALIKKANTTKQLGFYYYKWVELFPKGTDEYKEIQNESSMKKSLIENPDLKDNREGENNG